MEHAAGDGKRNGAPPETKLGALPVPPRTAAGGREPPNGAPAPPKTATSRFSQVTSWRPARPSSGGLATSTRMPPSRDSRNSRSRAGSADDVHRVARVNAHNHFCDNVISTSKYSAWSFIPRSLFEQFRRVANVYFLAISILMLIGTYLPQLFQSPLSAYSTLGPLCLILALTMIKEGLEDLTRHRSDNEVNNRSVLVLQSDGSELPVLWKRVEVGSIIRVMNRAEVPADVIILQTSEPRSVCYVETSNIDGETNLKLKEAVLPAAEASGGCTPAGIGMDPSAALRAAGGLTGDIVYDEPNDKIHHFTGKMALVGVHNGSYVPVGARNMVLRGCQLRNTKWALGLVVYTGRETKVMKKSGGARSKMSQVEKTMNMCIKIVFAAQALLCTFTDVAHVIWNRAYESQYTYLLNSSNTLLFPTTYWIGDWFTFLLLFNNFIPISLYVTVEIVNYVQAFLINTDAAMWDPISDTPARARTSNLNQDLGQIEYVFSDKTGTLTRNVMEFKQCSIAGRVYGSFTPDADAAGTQSDESSADGRKLELAQQQRAIANAPWWTRAALCGRSLITSGSTPHGATAPSSTSSTSTSAPPSPATRGSSNDKMGAGGSNEKTVDPATPFGGGGSGFDDAPLLAALRFGGVGYGAEWKPLPPSTGTGAGSAGGSPTSSATAAAAAAAAGGRGPLTPAEVVAAEAFFACMAVCHTVVPEYEGSDTPESGADPVFQAESPDEGALAKAARDVGFEFRVRNADHIIVRRVGGGGLEKKPGSGASSLDLEWSILGVHEFNSTRKRMSIVCKSPDGRFLLMCKGADNVIFDRSLREAGREGLEADLTRFASDGLRTLVLAQRVMSAGEVGAWQTEHAAASVALKDREEKLAAVAERVEVGLTVLGATAIEDRLQEGVPGTIRDLARAGIKTWVLTGDKVETAINIGFSSRLLDPSMELIQVLSEDGATLHRQLAALEERFKPLLSGETKTGGWANALTCGCYRGASSGSSSGRSGRRAAAAATGTATTGATPRVPRVTRRGGSSPGIELQAMGASSAPRPLPPSAPGGSTDVILQTNTALVVTGTALSHILGHPDLERALLTVARCCRSVIACRVSPQQKASIVQMVRVNVVPRPMTLAIGDGANDVGMIQRAEVGVGISGKEGLQAVNAADFAIAQFRFLRRLLLVHGRWSYRRMTKVVLYSFYKNVIITLSLFYFNALAAFSGTSFYESFVYSTYNFVLGLPIIFVGILDRDISDRAALAHPAVYTQGRLFWDLNGSRMAVWLLKAIAHSLIVFWLPYGVFSGGRASANLDGDSWAGGSASSGNGMSDGMAVAGLATFSSLVWAMQVKVGLETLSWTWLNVLMIVISQVGFYVFILIYQTMGTTSPDFYGVASVTLSRPSYWLLLLLVIGAMVIFEVSLELLRVQIAPYPVDIARELDAGYGVPDADGVVRWGDEDRAVKAMSSAEIAAASGGGGPAKGAAVGGSGGVGAAAAKGGAATLWSQQQQPRNGTAPAAAAASAPLVPATSFSPSARGGPSSRQPQQQQQQPLVLEPPSRPLPFENSVRHRAAASPAAAPASSSALRGSVVVTSWQPEPTRSPSTTNASTPSSSATAPGSPLGGPGTPNRKTSTLAITSASVSAAPDAGGAHFNFSSAGRVTPSAAESTAAGNGQALQRTESSDSQRTRSPANVGIVGVEEGSPTPTPRSSASSSFGESSGKVPASAARPVFSVTKRALSNPANETGVVMLPAESVMGDASPAALAAMGVVEGADAARAGARTHNYVAGGATQHHHTARVNLRQLQAAQGGGSVGGPSTDRSTGGGGSTSGR